MSSKRSVNGCFAIHGRRDRVVAKVDGVKKIVSSSELDRLLREGYDVEVVGSF